MNRTKEKLSIADVAGLGSNATDIVVRLPYFPAPDSKVELLSAERKAGGQVASALVACSRWGLRARYIGKIGDDDAGIFQRKEMKREKVEAQWIATPGCASQSSFILVDQRSGERTVLWKRDAGIAVHTEDLRREWISGVRALLVDGHDTKASAQAAQWAHEENIPVVGDFDNRYAGVKELLEVTDFPITSKDFPERFTGEADLLKSLPIIFRASGCRLIIATMGRLGALAWNGARFLLCPGFHVEAVDTTGAGDIFHGAFLYALVHGWEIKDTLEFCCAAAALNCKALGARGGIATLDEIESLRLKGERSELAYEPEVLLEAAHADTGGAAP